MQVFWLPAGYGNAQLGFPFTWLIEDSRWAPRHEVFIRDPHAPVIAETWNMTCIRCHVTAGQPRPRPEEEVFQTRVGELGIACEACHGPAMDHVAFHRAAAAHNVVSQNPPSLPGPDPAAGTQMAEVLSPAEDLADPIVHPRKLDHVRSSHVCGQCHAIKWFDEAENWVENGFRYRPGDDLEATTPIVRPSQLQHQPWMQRVLERAPQLFEEFFWSDGMIRVAGREFNGLLESPCYQQGEMSCLSCHSMHGYAHRADQLRPGIETNRACTQCHDAARYGPAHSHHPADSTGDLCYNCHMPHTTYALLKGVRQHEIDSPSVTVTLETGRLNACNLCHLDRSLAWTAATLQRWYGQPAVGITDEQASTAAVIRHLLTGDAGQRALAAWHLGWGPALAVSGNDWQAPLLATLLKDPYSAVRHIAHRSLSRLPGFTNFMFDFAGPPPGLEQASRDAASRWQGAPGHDASRRASLLLRPDGHSDRASVDALLARRNDRSMRLRE
jgi:hypothetical protein